MSTQANNDGQQLETQPSVALIGATKAIIDTLIETIGKRITQKGSLNAQDFSDVVSALRYIWPETERVLKRTCSNCAISKHEPVYIRDGRRTDYFSRLMFSRIVSAITPRSTGPNSKPYPFITAGAFQRAVNAVFTENEYRLLNDQVMAVYGMAKTDDDAQFWKTCETNTLVSAATDKLFLQCLSKFSHFLSMRNQFLYIMAEGCRDSDFLFSGREFCEFFDALFKKYFDMLDEPSGTVMMDILAGSGTAERADRIRSAYFHFRKSFIK
ncbi:hypothetical protein CCP2SC5_240028 [Azospirillaceae bacterium]